MKIWHISDTHMHHHKLDIPSDADMVIHSGDATNWNNPIRNNGEMHQFIEWFSSLPIRHKVFVPGNHDVSIEHRLFLEEQVTSRGIHLLVDSGVEIEGNKIWGSPWTRKYGSWAWMVDRSRLNRIWDLIPRDTDILVTHSPPEGILDFVNGDHEGCEHLMQAVMEIKPKLMLFGHIHSRGFERNNGVVTLPGVKTIFSNGSCCDDGIYDTNTSSGNIINLD